jgi:hypothetical protein
MSDRDETKIEDDLMARAAALPTGVKPDRDLWPGIEQAISRPDVRERSFWNTVWAQAAAVILLVGGSSGLTYLAVKGGEDATVPTVAGTTPLVFEPVDARFGSQYTLGPDYIDARRVLTGNLDEELDRLSPEAREEVLTNMQTIREAIDDINRALAEDPDNVLLQRMLLNTYRDELSLMMQIDGITREVMNRGDI